jgi:hypothetical protein
VADVAVNAGLHSGYVARNLGLVESAQTCEVVGCAIVKRAVCRAEACFLWGRLVKVCALVGYGLTVPHVAILCCLAEASDGRENAVGAMAAMTARMVVENLMIADVRICGLDR